MRSTPRKKNIVLALVVTAGVVLVLLAAFLTWALTPFPPDDEAIAYLESTAYVDVLEADGGWLEFAPNDDDPHVGLVLYPGARVSPEAYAPLAADIAERGYFVAVVPMRLNLAILSPNAAQAVIDAHPEIMIWTIGGHSLGGSMAAQFASENTETVSALALLASYPPASVDLSDSRMPVTSIFGTMDGVLDGENLMESADLLPPETDFVSIEGGNHAQFGSYGAQPGDSPAAIAADDQRWQTATAVTRMLLPFRIKTGS